LAGVAVTKKERDKILKAGFDDAFIQRGNYYEIKSKNGRCHFLKNELCLIQEIKPLLCKIWPVYTIFKRDKKEILVVDCPLARKLSKKEIQKLKTMTKKVTKGLAMLDYTNVPASIKKKFKKLMA